MKIRPGREKQVIMSALDNTAMRGVTVLDKHGSPKEWIKAGLLVYVKELFVIEPNESGVVDDAVKAWIEARGSQEANGD